MLDRLTKWNETMGRYTLPQGHGKFREIAQKLAAYENTGLTPEEIVELKEEKPRWQWQPTPEELEFFKATVIDHSENSDLVPHINPVNNMAIVSLAMLQRYADNWEESQVAGANYLAIVVYPDHWHLVQVSGYSQETGLFCRLCL